MGFRFRRSLKILPGIRLNLSGSGASVSLGTKGLRYTIGTKGKHATVGIPGTGLSYSHYQPYRRPQSSQVNAPIDSDETIESSSIDEIQNSSTSELAVVIHKTLSRIPFWPFIVAAALASVLVAVFTGNAEWTFLALLVAVFSPFFLIIDERRRSISLSYILNHATSEKYHSLLESFASLKSSSGLWHIPAEVTTSDWKRNAGAGRLVTRHSLVLGYGKPRHVRGELEFPFIQPGKQKIYFTPHGIFLSEGSSLTSLSYLDLQTRAAVTRYREDGAIPSDANVLDYTWRFVAKSGGPDRRFNGNHQIPICEYGQLDFFSSGGLQERIMGSNASSIFGFSNSLDAMDVDFSSQIALTEWPGINTTTQDTGSTIIVAPHRPFLKIVPWLMIAFLSLPATAVGMRHFFLFSQNQIKPTMRSEAVQKLVVDPVKNLPQVVPAVQSYVNRSLDFETNKTTDLKIPIPTVDLFVAPVMTGQGRDKVVPLPPPRPKTIGR